MQVLVFFPSGLQKEGVLPEEVDFVVGTHGHSDHIGNLNLFPQATFIVCYDISSGNTFLPNRLSEVTSCVLSPTDTQITR